VVQRADSSRGEPGLLQAGLGTSFGESRSVE
jgi:hypothetical protein